MRRRQETAVIKLKTNVNTSGMEGWRLQLVDKSRVKAQKTMATVGRKRDTTTLSRGKLTEITVTRR